MINNNNINNNNKYLKRELNSPWWFLVRPSKLSMKFNKLSHNNKVKNAHSGNYKGVKFEI